MQEYFRVVMEINDERISEVGENTQADCEAGNRHESETSVLLSPTL